MSEETNPQDLKIPMSEETDQASDEKENGVKRTTKRDMESVTDVVEDRQIDISRLEKSINKLAEISSSEAAISKSSPQPRYQVAKEDLVYFMEQTGLGKQQSEVYFNRVQGDLDDALALWITHPTLLKAR